MAAPLNALSAAAIAKGVAAGAFTAEAVARAHIARIESREPEIEAFAAFDPEHVLLQARAVDKAQVKGPLAGVPVGVKDVIDTFDLPTQMGSPIYKNNRPPNDAACVARLRAAGAVILGKTVTCEFAGATPAATRNPHDLARTPGGSSSGSAAAVANLMAPLALGTQTRGSVLRPASFCGITGYKPSYGSISRDGLKFAAESFDTIGILARNVADAALGAAILAGRPPVPLQTLSAPPAIGLCREGMDRAQPESIAAIEDSAKRLAAAGARIADFAFPGSFDALTAATKTVNDVERSRAMAWEWNAHRELISEGLSRTIEQGLAVAEADYIAALRLIAETRSRIAAAFGGVGIVLTPAANGEAPKGISYTGDPFFQGIWTALHLPAIALPTHKGPNGLPVGIQLAAPLYADDALLAAAAWVHSHLVPAP